MFEDMQAIVTVWQGVFLLNPAESAAWHYSDSESKAYNVPVNETDFSGDVARVHILYDRPNHDMVHFCHRKSCALQEPS